MENKREQIIRVASELILLKGFHSTSVDDILQHSGTKKGNFYFYFRSKEELGFAVIRYHMETFWQKRLTPILQSQEPPLSKIHAIFQRLVEEQTKAQCFGGCPFGNMALELSDTHEGFRSELEQMFASLVEMFHTLLRQAEAELRDGVDLAELAQFIVASIEGGIMLTKVQKNVLPLKRCIRQLENYLAKLRRDPQPQGGGVQRGVQVQ